MISTILFINVASFAILQPSFLSGGHFGCGYANFLLLKTSVFPRNISFNVGGFGLI